MADTVRAEVRILADGDALIRAAAAVVGAAALLAQEQRNSFTCVLSGGSTPRALYELLSQQTDSAAIDWTRTAVYFGDERCVSPGHGASNYGMARRALIDRILISPERVHRIKGEMDPEQAARAYETEIRDLAEGGIPSFDLVLLGMGADGHTASLFPAAEVLAERERLVVPTTAPVDPQQRITMTLPLLNAAREVVFLVTGSQKAEAVLKVMQQGQRAGIEPQAEILPAALVRPDRGRLLWLLDEAAARLYQQWLR